MHRDFIFNFLHFIIYHYEFKNSVISVNQIASLFNLNSHSIFGLNIYFVYIIHLKILSLLKFSHCLKCNINNQNIT